MNRLIALVVIAFSAVFGLATTASGQGEPLRGVPSSASGTEFPQHEMIEVALEHTPQAVSKATLIQPNTDPMDEPLPVVIPPPRQGTQYCLSSESGLCNGSACQAAGCHGSNCSNCCQRSSSTDSYARRIKFILQRSHWGYCNHFDDRPLGDAVFTTLSQQVDQGSTNMMMLYHYDFYPAESARAGELTPRGNQQLLKIIDRMHTVPAPIVVEIMAGRPELNIQRCQNVVQSLAQLGVPISEEFVILGRLKHGARGVEAAATYQNLMNSIQKRGRTIEASESARFGGQSR